jgi:tripeptidyl-peptidase-1
MFNTKGRGRPDLSAVGHNAMIVDNGFPGLIGGTSQSSPIVASIMALLTNEYIKITGKPFGFLNQFLYQMYAADPTTFNDVIAGDNICPEYGCSPTCRGFIATYGWDPVTGLGTPNYPNMVNYVQKLGANVVARRQARQAAAAAKPAVFPRRDQTKFTSA